MAVSCWLRVGRLGLLAGTIALYSASAEAAPVAVRQANGLSSAAIPANTVERLRSGDPARVQSALDDVRIAGRGGEVSAKVIVSLLRQGMSVSLTQAAIETLGETGSASAGDVLSSYARHRHVSIRKASVQALARTGGPVAIRALKLALSDPDPSVRGVAATGLGALKAHEATPELLAALDHGVSEASASVGLLCAGSECDKLAYKLGRIPLPVVMSGLERMLLRPTSEVGDDAKLAIVARIRDLGTSGAHDFFVGLQKGWPKGGSPRVLQAIDQAALVTSASPGRQPFGGGK